MRKRGLFCLPVSLYLPVTFLDSIQVAEDITKLYSHPSSPIILVF